MQRRAFLSKTAMIYAVAAMLMGGACAAGAAEPAAKEKAMSQSKHVFVLIEIKAAEGAADRTRETFTTVIKTSHKPGIVSAQVFEHASEPGRFYSLQEWESEAAFRTHMSDNSEGLNDNMKLLQGMPSLTILKPLSETIRY